MNRFRALQLQNIHSKVLVCLWIFKKY